MARQGFCKLTGKAGAFVKSHLIPRAFTKPVPGTPFVQAGDGRPERRWDSWYDDRLVTQEGEDILSSLDNWAITELRRLRLVWSGWGPITTLRPDVVVTGTSWGVRQVKCCNTARLLAFFRSLLWRAAASSRPEFAPVRLHPSHQEILRSSLVNGPPPPLAFYPVTLIQLSTLGPFHNLSPLYQVKQQPAVEGVQAQSIPIYRFYFDGLIAHFHIQATDDGYASSLGSLFVGASELIDITTVSSESSFEFLNFRRIQAEAEILWPDAMQKLHGLVR